MLKSLSIQNYALIDQLYLEPSEGLSIITGETGAGKSIMLGAIGLLLGNRADIKALFNKEKKCIIEGNFDLSQLPEIATLFETLDIDFDEDCFIRREINASGKSRAFINDSPVVLESLKKVGLKLIDVHSQHDTLNLQDQKFQLSILDEFAETAGLLEEYQSLYQQYSKSKGLLEQLKSKAGEQNKELDFHRFLLNELEEINLQEGEFEELSARLAILENAEEIKRSVAEVLHILDTSDYSVNDQLYQVSHTLNKLEIFDEQYAELVKRTDAMQAELDDIKNELYKKESEVDFDEQEALEVKSRVDVLNAIFQKHQVDSSSALMAIMDDLNGKVGDTTQTEEKINLLEKQMLKEYESAHKKAIGLSSKRQSTFRELKETMEQLLHKLGMPDAVFEVQQARSEHLGADGVDAISFLFSANKGVLPQALKSAASGGEFSRLQFSLKYLLAQKGKLPTLIFDEIDTGVSGEIALKMGDMMQEMAKGHQLITITHLPQIAGKGQAHFFVYKDNHAERTVSQVRNLSKDERINHLAEMIGGKDPSSSAFESAKELLS